MNDLLTVKGLINLPKAVDNASIDEINNALKICKDQDNHATKASEREVWKQLTRVLIKLKSDWE